MAADNGNGELTVSLSRRTLRIGGIVALVLVAAAAVIVAPVDAGDVTGAVASLGDTTSDRFQAERSGAADDTDSSRSAGQDTRNGTAWDIGPAGSTHEHAIFAVSINGRQIDFSRRAFQLRDRKVHFEAVNGTPNGRILHKHATGVTIGYTLSTLNMSLTEKCLSAGTRRFCEPPGNLSVFVNGSMIDNAPDHVIKEGEVIEILYRRG